MRPISMKLGAAAIAAGFGVMAVHAADAKAPAIKETMAISHMESQVKDARAPGIFGEYWWANRFLDKYMAKSRLFRHQADIVMLGDSIIHFWETGHAESWGRFCGKRRVLNLGYGGDMTQQVIWRIRQGELDGYEAKNVVILIGTNNCYSDKAEPENVAAGIRKVVELVKERQPKAKVILYAIFPRGANAESKFHAKPRGRCDRVNAIIAEWVKTQQGVDYVDIGAKFLDETGWVPKALMADEIHPTDAGYDIWTASINEHLAK